MSKKKKKKPAAGQQHSQRRVVAKPGFWTNKRIGLMGLTLGGVALYVAGLFAAQAYLVASRIIEALGLVLFALFGSAFLWTLSQLQRSTPRAWSAIILCLGCIVVGYITFPRPIAPSNPPIAIPTPDPSPTTLARSTWPRTRHPDLLQPTVAYWLLETHRGRKIIYFVLHYYNSSSVNVGTVMYGLETPKPYPKDNPKEIFTELVTLRHSVRQAAASNSFPYTPDEPGQDKLGNPTGVNMSEKQFDDLMNGGYMMYVDVIVKPTHGKQLEVCSIYNGGGYGECPDEASPQ